MDAPGQQRRSRAPIERFSYGYLLIVPVLLAVATAALLFVHSDTDVPFLYSQCHARERIPWLSHIPVLGAPACALVSFFQEALASARSFAVMSVVLSFVAALLTVTTVESARICNAPNVILKNPTGPLLVFNLLGGAIIWQLVIIPAFFHRSQQILAARKDGLPGSSAGAKDPNVGQEMRHLKVDAEALAIPIAVALGYVLPSILMLVFDEPISISVWLFFPLWVSLIRQAIRFVIARVRESKTLHLESHRPSLILVYAVPIILSALSHGLFIYNLFQKDDRKHMTKVTLKFIEIDILFIGVTILYWIFIEAGWRVVLAWVVSSIVLGPGAGVCIAWIYREAAVTLDGAVESGAADEADGEDGEDTPLLR